MKKAAISIMVCLIAAFLGLRVYGAYQNEKLSALASAAEAERIAAIEQAEADRLREKLDCSDAWGKYEIALLDARLAQLKQGDAAYYKAKAKAKAASQRPLCDGGELPLTTALHFITEELEHHERAQTLLQYSEVLKDYAKARKLQTSYLAHKLWLSLTGTRVAQDDLSTFLANKQPKPKR